jgi:hypothetical protein
VAAIAASAKGEHKPDKVQEADAPTGNDADDRFERLARTIPRFPAKATPLPPVIWEWDTLSAHAETLADRLPNVLRCVLKSGWLP